MQAQQGQDPQLAMAQQQMQFDQGMAQQQMQFDQGTTMAQMQHDASLKEREAQLKELTTLGELRAKGEQIRQGYVSAGVRRDEAARNRNRR